MYIYIYTYIYIHYIIHDYICIYIHINMCIYICTYTLYIIDVYTFMIMHVCPDIISIWVWLHGLTKIGCLDCGPKVSQFRDVLSPIFGRNRRNSIVAGYEAIAASPTIPSSNLNPTVGLANIGDFVKDAEHTNKSLYLLAVWHPAWINTQSILWSLKDSFTFWPQATLLRRATGWQCFCVGCHRTVSFTVAPISGPGDMIGQVKLNDMVGVLWPFLRCERMMLNYAHWISRCS